MGDKRITVFTPTYNRAYILPQCYEALKRQTYQDFIWLIVDDGSNDDTKGLIQGWINEGCIEIKYIYQENLGMHGAHNTGHKNLTTELCIGCDSDDYLLDDCIEKVLKTWDCRPQGEYSGVIGLCKYSNGRTHTNIPSELEETTLYDLRYRYKNRGDYKFALRSDLLKQQYYPMIDGEKYMAVGYKYFVIDQQYKMRTIHDHLCCQNYLEDGEGSNKIKRYVTAPKGYMVYRNEMLPLMHNFKERCWQATHYVSSAIFAKEKRFILNSKYKYIVILAIPSGLILNLLIRYRYYKKLKSEGKH